MGSLGKRYLVIGRDGDRWILQRLPQRLGKQQLRRTTELLDKRRWERVGSIRAPEWWTDR
jgi:uncharacterized protein YebE (UPF0316 family)